MSFPNPDQNTQEQRNDSPTSAIDKRNVKTMSPSEFSQAIKRDVGYATFFTDPMTGERLSVDRPPDFLLQDPELKSGYEFLTQLGQHLDLEVMLAPHNPNRPDENFGNREFDFEGKVKGSDVVLLEGVAWQQKEKDMLNALSSKNGLPIDSDVITKYTAFKGANETVEYGDTSKLRELNAISRSGAKISFYDVEKKDDETGIRNQIIGNLDFLKVLQQAPVVGVEGREAEIAKSIAVDKEIISLEALREWQMVCNTGFQVGEILQNNPDLLAKVGVEKLKVLMVVGKAHKDLIRKFGKSGVQAKASSPDGYALSSSTEKISEWLAQGFIDNTELKRLNQ
jgi:hypothetical protein